MTVIRQAIGDYLAVRRALGYKLEDHDWLLADFASFVEAAGAGTVTTSLALDWATQPENVLPSWHAARLRVVRGFARHLQALDPATEVPPAGLLASRNRRAVPYLYSDAEVKALMAATGSLRPALHAATHKTLIGLLAVTGMRLGEVIRLDCAELNTAEGIVTIRDSKFAKSRQVPLHPSTLNALAEYAQIRARHFPQPKTPSLLVSTAGTRLISQGVHYVFARLVRQAGLQPRSPDCRPRLHDFRHYADGRVMCPAVAFPMLGAAEVVSRSA
jgi:integrase/recombinase XerD